MLLMTVRHYPAIKAALLCVACVANTKGQRPARLKFISWVRFQRDEG